jgi:transcriptional regulator with XRE-family HTH domain
MTAQELARWRRMQGFSIRKAAETLGCSRIAFTRWERGEQQAPRYIALACTAIAMGVTTSGTIEATEKDYDT